MKVRVAALRQILWGTILLTTLGACSDTTSDQQKPANSPRQVNEKTVKKPVEQAKPISYKRLSTESAPPFLRTYGAKNPENLFRVDTRFGPIVIRLYKDTPLHRASFVYLAKRNYFDMTQFYRVSKDFVCQAGNSDDWETQELRATIGRYRLAREIQPHHFHRYGAVASARRYEDNPKKLESAFEWYIVKGLVYNEPTLRAISREQEITFSPEQIKAYTTVGGNPYLDGEHTVFGEVVSGMDVVEKMNTLETDGQDWPKEIVPIQVTVLE